MMADTPAGRRSYEHYLTWQLAEGPAGRSAAYVSMSRGWALGSQEFKRTLLQDHAVAEEIRAWETDGALQVRTGKWLLALERLLREIPAQEKADTRGAAPWKIRTAIAMKTSTDAGNHWLAQQLQIASPRYLAKLVCLAQRR